MARAPRYTSSSGRRAVHRYAQVRGCPPEQGICREDPIPKGVYWIDSIDVTYYAGFGKDGVAIQQARQQFAQDTLGKIKLLRTANHSAGSDPVDEPAREWILFEVLEPVPRWPVVTEWGFPTVAPKGRDTQEEDTRTRPPPESFGDIVGSELGLDSDDINPWFLVGGAVLGGGLVVYLVSR